MELVVGGNCVELMGGIAGVIAASGWWEEGEASNCKLVD